MKQQPTEFSIISKWNNKINLKRKQIDYKYSKMLNLRKEKLEQRKSRELERIEKKWKKLMDIELHNLTSKRQRNIPVDKTISKVKKKALAEIQLYAKLSRAYIAGGIIMIFLYDKQISVPLDKTVNGGHCYPQKNYPQLAFNINNIRPISSWGNKKQLDNVADRKCNLPNTVRYSIEQITNDKTYKNQLRCREFYLEQIEKYKKLNEIEKRRLGIS